MPMECLNKMVTFDERHKGGEELNHVGTCAKHIQRIENSKYRSPDAALCLWNARSGKKRCVWLEWNR